MIARTITRRLQAAALAGAVAAGLLAGCSAHPGTAAIIDGKRLSESQLAAAQADFEFLQAPMATEEITAELIQAPAMHRVAQSSGHAKSDDDALASLRAVAKQKGINDSAHTYAATTVDVIRTKLERDAMSKATNVESLNAEFVELVGQVKVTMNPRYGSWDRAEGLSPASYPWLKPSAK